MEDQHSTKITQEGHQFMMQLSKDKYVLAVYGSIHINYAFSCMCTHTGNCFVPSHQKRGGDDHKRQ